MKPRVEVILLCDQIIQDAMTGKNTAVGIFDRIAARQFPAVHPQVAILAVVTGAPSQKVLCTLRVTAPSGHLGDFPIGEVQLSNPHGKANLVSVMGGFPLREPGEYRFQIAVNDEPIGETKLFVDQVTTATGSDHSVH